MTETSAYYSNMEFMMIGIFLNTKTETSIETAAARFLEDFVIPVRIIKDNQHKLFKTYQELIPEKENIKDIKYPLSAVAMCIRYTIPFD